MANQQIVNYIKQSLDQGQNEEDIRRALVVAGWSTEEIDSAFGEVKNPGALAPVLPPSPAATGIFPGIFDSIKSAWEIYKQRFWVIIKLAFLPIGAVIVFGAIIALSLFLLLGDFSVLTKTPSVFSGSSALLATAGSILSGGLTKIIIGIIGLIFLISVIIIGLWSQVALMVAIRDRAETIGAKESLRRAWPKVRSYFLVSLLAGFLTIGGFMLAIVPGIIFSIWFSLGIYVFIDQDIKGMNALLKSKEYVRGRWWGVFWRFLGFGLLIGAVSIILNIIPFVNFLSWLVSAFLFTPLGVIYSYIVYSNLKTLKGEFEFVPQKKGLFVGIAVLGVLLVPGAILATIFLVSLNSARTKASDAAIKSQIMQARFIAELIYERDGSFTNLCNARGLLNDADQGSPSYGPQLATIGFEIAKKTMSAATCNVSGTRNYCISSRLKSDSENDFCVDATGFVGNKICQPSGFCQ